MLKESFCAAHTAAGKRFILSNAVQNINKINSGACPHGCVPSACPICSGMGGGSMRAGERPQKAGEMSYHQCAMIGAMMRAREARLEEHEKNLQARAELLKNFVQGLEAATAKLAAFAEQISKSFIFKPVSFTIKNIVVPIINVIKNVTVSVQNVLNKLSQIKIDIQDKLNAIFGEAKAFAEKKVSELISSVKTKLNNLFKVFKRNNKKDDETKIDEDKKIFNLKTFIQKILKQKKDGNTKNKS